MAIAHKGKEFKKPPIAVGMDEMISTIQNNQNNIILIGIGWLLWKACIE